MQEIINCPSCQRRLQVPESLLGQDVQCPTCGATFVAALGGAARAAARFPEDNPTLPLEGDLPRERPARPRRREDDYGDDDDREPYRRRRRRDYLPHRGGAVLTLGILSLVLACAGLVLGPMAWAMGSTDLSEIRAGRMDPEGEGLTNAGRICGILGTVFSLIWLCAGGAIILASLTAAGRHG